MKYLSILTGLSVVLTFSGCINTQFIEKTDTFNGQRKSIQKMVLLDPDYYRYDPKSDDLAEDAKTTEESLKLTQYSMQSLRRLSVEAVDKDIKNINPSGDVNANSLNLLKQQIQRECLQFQLNNANNVDEFSQKEVISQDIYLSPEYSKLISVFNTPYYYYTLAVDYSNSLVLISALADVSKGKIIYTEVKKVSMPFINSTLWQMTYGSFNQMLTAK